MNIVFCDSKNNSEKVLVIKMKKWGILFGAITQIVTKTQSEPFIQFRINSKCDKTIIETKLKL